MGKEDGDVPGYAAGREEHAEQIRPGKPPTAFDVVSGIATVGSSD